jgi:Alcohol dehydrogenase, class IV
MKVFTYLPIKKVYYGEDANEHIMDFIRVNSKLYIVTGRRTSESNEFKNILKKLESKRINYEILNFISQHSPDNEIEIALQQIDDHHEHDILGYGGGSVIDASKILKLKSNAQTLIAVPTTLSASEFSHIAGYSENGEKKGIRDINITPDYIVLDPRNTISTPRELYMASGIRAIDHAIESALDLGLSDPRLYTSVISYKLLRDNLRGSSLEERMLSQIGSWFSYFNVFDSPMGLSHAIGKIIGAKYGIPHGFTSCITLPVIIDYYEKTGRLDNFLNLLFQKVDYKELKNEVVDLIKSIPAKTKLSEYGLGKEDIDIIMEKLNVNHVGIENYLEQML